MFHRYLTSLCLLLLSGWSMADATLIPYQADYTTEWKVGWFSIDIDAQRTLKQLPDNQWQLSFHAETGAAALTETSVLSYANGRLWPQHYQYRASGLFNENDRTLSFDHTQQRVMDAELDDKIYSNGWIALEDDGPLIAPHDNLTYMQQAALDLAAGAQEFAYPVFEKNKSKVFRFAVVAEETLETAIGPLATVKVQQLRSSNKRQIFAWFSKQHNYTLVRLVDRKDGKKRYQIDLQRIDMQPLSANEPDEQ
ncbi:hypothetical protein CHH28_17540 [Bacterioplanes sanyensis]|uniref:DUF3108 domain-containing protein n=1 Tax=Bacterioplanes sanyensis TaxID=1249553 RepID=A0A222FNN3_9GAMM|nr:DUF3108 domain-containing protein [Bacterioplanes sanyensis]ASP40369.1 hypothetical protein CHH28_17540 [Bacterioplanes sanyensis]